ncbi:hypothetical protein BJ322DRAFT_1064788 [Thelephora terrestris]|uniref:Zn(2)-C6 fungal-type domain-containing protein n=1 Tax=Thelephora terrestris TaxID=56493 RepID=A0A9P6HDI4_9AGAM|nr:hypothetical protein BJ322DRAFT_1064788 [Thelephora terrestris]
MMSSQQQQMYPQQQQYPVPDSAEPITPRRTPMACQFCRGRKIKCDGRSTCANCNRRNIPCVYVPVAAQGK